MVQSLPVGNANSISYGRIVYSLFNYCTRNRQFRNLNELTVGNPQQSAFAAFAKPPWAKGGPPSRKTEVGVPLGNLRIVKRPPPYRDNGREWLVILLALCLRLRTESYRIVANSAIIWTKLALTQKRASFSPRKGHLVKASCRLGSRHRLRTETGSQS